MNLAPPAPCVEAAVAERVEYAESAIAAQVQQSEAVRVSAAQKVDPSVPVDDPLRFAPANVANPKKQSPPPLSVTALRGNHGAVFEGYAAVLRGAPEKHFFKRCLPCIYDERDFVSYGEVKKYVLIKGDSCFIFMEHTDLAPLYAIPLCDVYPVQEDRHQLDPFSVTVSPEPNSNLPRKEMVTVLLKYRRNNGQAFQFTFNTESDPSLAKRFYDAVQVAGSKGQPVTASVVHAKRAGKEAAKQQPLI